MLAEPTNGQQRLFNQMFVERQRLLQEIDELQVARKQVNRQRTLLRSAQSIAAEQTEKHDLMMRTELEAVLKEKQAELVPLAEETDRLQSIVRSLEKRGYREELADFVTDDRAAVVREIIALELDELKAAIQRKVEEEQLLLKELPRATDQMRVHFSAMERDIVKEQRWRHSVHQEAMELRSLQGRIRGETAEVLKAQRLQQQHPLLPVAAEHTQPAATIAAPPSPQNQQARSPVARPSFEVVAQGEATSTRNEPPMAKQEEREKEEERQIRSEEKPVSAAVSTPKHRDPVVVEGGAQREKNVASPAGPAAASRTETRESRRGKDSPSLRPISSSGQQTFVDTCDTAMVTDPPMLAGAAAPNELDFQEEDTADSSDYDYFRRAPEGGRGGNVSDRSLLYSSHASGGPSGYSSDNSASRIKKPVRTEERGTVADSPETNERAANTDRPKVVIASKRKVVPALRLAPNRGEGTSPYRPGESPRPSRGGTYSYSRCGESSEDDDAPSLYPQALPMTVVQQTDLPKQRNRSPIPVVVRAASTSPSPQRPGRQPNPSGSPSSAQFVATELRRAVNWKAEEQQHTSSAGNGAEAGKQSRQPTGRQAPREENSSAGSQSATPTTKAPAAAVAEEPKQTRPREQLTPMSASSSSSTSSRHSAPASQQAPDETVPSPKSSQPQEHEASKTAERRETRHRQKTTTRRGDHSSSEPEPSPVTHLPAPVPRLKMGTIRRLQ